MKRLTILALIAFSELIASRTQAQSASSWSLSNTSALVKLAPGGNATAGFVVTGPAGANPVFVLVRAVGPTLANYGITNPAPLPQFQLLDSKGQNHYGIIVLGQIDWNATFASVGAFPLTSGEIANGSVGLYALPAGSYTVQATDASGSGGAVLIEVYLNVKPTAVPGSVQNQPPLPP